MGATLKNASDQTLGNVLAGSLSLATWGNWLARLEIDAAVAPAAGAVILEVEGERTTARFFGAARSSQPWQGRVKLLVVGGAGRLLEELPGKDFVSAPVPPTGAAILADIAASAGEQLDAEAALIATTLPRWSRPAGAVAADAIAALVGALGLTWRVLDTGRIWAGAEIWPALGPEIVAGVYVQRDDGELGILDVAPDEAALRPGTTLLGRRLVRVVYDLGGKGLRAELHYQRGTG